MFTSGPRPNHGAVGATFLCARAMQIISLLCAIGLTSNFVSEIVSSNLEAPRELVGTLSVVCIGIIYCIITLICYADNILPFLFTTASDSLVLVALIVVAAVVGKPLTYLNCRAIGDEDQVASAWDLTTALKDTPSQSDGLLYIKLVDTSRTTCLELKAVWGLSIALCILFTFSTLSSIMLWRRKPTATKAVNV